MMVQQDPSFSTTLLGSLTLDGAWRTRRDGGDVWKAKWRRKSERGHRVSPGTGWCCRWTNTGMRTGCLWTGRRTCEAEKLARPRLRWRAACWPFGSPGDTNETRIIDNFSSRFDFSAVKPDVYDQTITLAGCFVQRLVTEVSARANICSWWSFDSDVTLQWYVVSVALRKRISFQLSDRKHRGHAHNSREASWGWRITWCSKKRTESLKETHQLPAVIWPFSHGALKRCRLYKNQVVCTLLEVPQWITSGTAGPRAPVQSINTFRHTLHCTAHATSKHFCSHV